MIDKKNYFKTNTKYSITLNPIDKHQYFGSAKRYILFRAYIYEQLLSLTCEYQLYIEISEPHGMHTQGYTGPRLHLHARVAPLRNAVAFIIR